MRILNKMDNKIYTTEQLKRIITIENQNRFILNKITPVIIEKLRPFLEKNIKNKDSSVIKKFSLNYRQQDGYDDAINSTYWRIYVPRGVAGTCSGNIIFGATKAAGSS